MPSIRHTYAAIMIASVALILIAIFLEHVKGMEPCSLCITQRFFVILVGLLAFVAFVHNPPRITRRIYAAVGVLIAIGGGFFAGRQIWLQNLPEDQVPACGPGLTYILDQFPLAEALSLLMRGDGNCAHVDKILGLSLPWWTLTAFAAFALAFLFQACRRNPSAPQWK